jgi:hypothetical protein
MYRFETMPHKSRHVKKKHPGTRRLGGDADANKDTDYDDEDADLFDDENELPVPNSKPQPNAMMKAPPAQVPQAAMTNNQPPIVQNRLDAPMQQNPSMVPPSSSSAASSASSSPSSSSWFGNFFSSMSSVKEKLKNWALGKQNNPVPQALSQKGGRKNKRKAQRNILQKTHRNRGTRNKKSHKRWKY